MTIPASKTSTLSAARPTCGKGLTVSRHSFRIHLRWIPTGIPFSCLPDGTRIVTSACISMAMVLRCSINVWTTASCNGPKTKMRCGTFPNRNCVGSWKDYRSNSRRLSSHRRKGPFESCQAPILAFFRSPNPL